MTTEAEIPTQFTHSVKLEETAKGVRVSIHAYANSQTAAIFEAVETLVNTKAECTARGIVLAPVEVTQKK